MEKAVSYKSIGNVWWLLCVTLILPLIVPSRFTVAEDMTEAEIYYNGVQITHDLKGDQFTTVKFQGNFEYIDPDSIHIAGYGLYTYNIRRVGDEHLHDDFTDSECRQISKRCSNANTSKVKGDDYEVIIMPDTLSGRYSKTDGQLELDSAQDSPWISVITARVLESSTLDTGKRKLKYIRSDIYWQLEHHLEFDFRGSSFDMTMWAYIINIGDHNIDFSKVHVISCPINITDDNDDDNDVEHLSGVHSNLNTNIGEFIDTMMTQRYAVQLPNQTITIRQNESVALFVKQTAFHKQNVFMHVLITLNSKTSEWMGTFRTIMEFETTENIPAGRILSSDRKSIISRGHLPAIFKYQTKRIDVDFDSALQYHCTLHNITEQYKVKKLFSCNVVKLRYFEIEVRLTVKADKDTEIKDVAILPGNMEFIVNTSSKYEFTLIGGGDAVANGLNQWSVTFMT